MSFKLMNLTPLAQGKHGAVPCSYTYWDEDNDTLIEEGFFTKDSGLRNGDQLTIISNNYTTVKTGFITEREGALLLTIRGQ